MKKLSFFGLIGLSIFFSSSTCAQTNIFPSSGNVGIGTTNPQWKLDLGISNGSSADGILGWQYNSANANSRSWGIGKDVNAYGDFVILTSDAQDYTLDTYRLLIDKDGKVGIGTTSPNAVLHISHAGGYSPNLIVSGDGEQSLKLFNTNATGNTVCSVKFANRSNSDWAWILYNDDYNDGTNDFTLANRSGTQIYISAENKIGIGTTSPAAKLDVNGDIYLKGNKGLASDGTCTYLQSGNHIYFETSGSSRMTITSSGLIGIGTNNPQNKLDVNGTVHAKEFKASLDGWSDFVFDNNYHLMSLTDVENYIKIHNKLPEIPSAEEVSKNGINLGEMNAKLLQKIEELTIYTIEQSKKIHTLEEKIEKMESFLKEY